MHWRFILVNSKFFLKGMIIIICLMVLSSVVSCSSSSSSTMSSLPDATVSNFFNAIINSNLVEAKSYIINNNSILEFNNERNKRVVIKVFSMIKYEIVSSSIEKNSAVVKVKLLTPDMAKITVKVIGDVMINVSKISNNGGRIEISDSEKMAEEYYNQMLSDPEVQIMMTNLKINLTKENDRWLIRGDGKFKNTITGNMLKSNE